MALSTAKKKQLSLAKKCEVVKVAEKIPKLHHNSISMLLTLCMLRATRVAVVVLCVCMCVCSLISAASHIGIIKERYQRVHSSTQIVLNVADFPKNALLKVWRNMPTSSSFGILTLFPHEIRFYASLKPTATFLLHRQRACGRQCAIRWQRLMKWHRYTDHK